MSLTVTVLLPGCFWAQDTLRGARWQRILLASHLFPYLSPCLFPTCLLTSLSPLRFFSLGAFGQRNLLCLPFLTSLSIAQCSSFWWLWGQDSSPICFRTRLSTSLSHVAVLSGCFRGTVCSLSSVCLRACPPCSLQLVPLLLSLSLSFSLSLSLLLFFSLGAYLDTWFSLVPHLSSLVLPCSLQRVSLIPSSLLLLLGKERISWPLVFLLNFSSFVQVTFPYPRSLPHVTLLTFLRVSNLSPYSLSTTVLLSRSPAFGRERIVFLLFPFFPSLSLWSFPALSSLLSSFLLFSLLGPKIPLVSHVFPSVSFFSQFFSYLLFCLGFRTSSFLFVPPCYCSSSWVLLGTGYSSWCSMAKDSSCLPFVSILVSLSVPNLSPYFSISIAILLSGCFRSKESACLPFLTSLSIAQCSSFWWLWGQDSSPICFRTRLSTSLSYVAVLSGCFRGTVCS